MKTYPERRTIRLQGYDYSSPWWYFVTICTHEREFIFGEIVNGQMTLNKLGKVVENVWKTLPEHHPIKLDAFQIMPNHVHFIVVIVGVGRDRPAPNPETITKMPGIPTGASRRAPTLGFIVGLFKSETAKQIRKIKFNNIFFKVWQRNYYERIIRNEKELFAIRQYIVSNPQNWEKDENNLNNFLL